MIITLPLQENIFQAKTVEELNEKIVKAFEELAYKPEIKSADDHIELNVEDSPAGMTALVQLGNLYLAASKPADAEKYYRMAMEQDPLNFIAVTNVGAACLDRKEYGEAIKLFEQALERNPYYVNAHYGRTLAYFQQGDTERAFQVCLDGTQKTLQAVDNSGTRDNLLRMLVSLAEKMVSETDFKPVIDGLKAKLEQADGKKIVIEADDNIVHSATLQVAKAQGNEAHEIKYQSNLPFTDYLILRKLIRLQMVQEARKRGKNKVVEFTGTNLANFNRRFGVFFSNFATKMKAESLEAFKLGVANGFSYQLMNFVHDLIVEDRIYFDYPQLRPMQLLYLTRQEQESLTAIRPSKELDLMPQTVVNASRLMVLIASLYYANLYGINVVSEYHGNEKEYQKVDGLYEEFIDYLEGDPQPGDEYALVEDFAEELGFGDLITVHGESGLIL